MSVGADLSRPPPIDRPSVAFTMSPYFVKNHYRPSWLSYFVKIHYWLSRLFHLSSWYCKRYDTGTISPLVGTVSFSCTLQKNRPATNNPIKQSSRNGTASMRFICPT